MNTPPIDATCTPAWKALERHRATFASFHLAQQFAQYPARTDALSFEVGDLFVDLSKNLITPNTLELFADLAEQVDLPGHRLVRGLKMLRV